MSKVVESAKILRQEELADGIYSMWIETNAAAVAHPGQFVSLYTGDEAYLLPRPISICEIDNERSALRLVYRVVGKGTKDFSQLKAENTIKIMGPLGNGFPIEKGNAVVIGGGIGVPPMLELVKQLPGSVVAVMGYRNAELFLKEEFDETADAVLVATDDGSVGTHGTVVDALREYNVMGDVIYACGPKPMLTAIKAYAAEKGIKCYISMEERMACGIGACLGCVCESTEVDEHSHVKNKRVCKDGPVFLAEEVEL